MRSQLVLHFKYLLSELIHLAELEGIDLTDRDDAVLGVVNRQLFAWLDLESDKLPQKSAFERFLRALNEYHLPREKIEELRGIFNRLKQRSKTQGEIKRYLTLIKKRYAHIDAAYIDLQSEVEPHLLAYGALIPIDYFVEETNSLSTFEDLCNIVALQQRVTLIGEPGAGKTTTLERIAYYFSFHGLNDPDMPIPIYIHLRDFVETDWLEFINQKLRSTLIPGLTTSEVILLLDGLNEVPRSKAIQIKHSLNVVFDWKFVVSCRTLDYRELQMKLTKIELKPLPVERIYAYILRVHAGNDTLFWNLAGTNTYHAWLWYQRSYETTSILDFWYGSIQNASTWEIEKFHLKTLQDELRKSGDLPQLLMLVQSPFLLYLISRIYIRSGGIPINRTELFEKFVDTVISENASKGVSESLDWLSPYTQRKALQLLAYEMQVSSEGQFLSQDKAEQLFATQLEENEPHLIVQCLMNTGLLVFASNISFSHDLFREYFAAFILKQEIDKGEPATKYWLTEEWWKVTGWEEIVIFLAGTYVDCTPVVKWLAEVQPELAYKCGTQLGLKCDPQVLETIQLPSADKRLSPRATAAWGKSIAPSDDRVGVSVRRDGLPDITWCKVPKGVHIVGGDIESFPLGYRPKYNQQLDIHIDYDFYISKYPITFRQIEGFVTETGNTPNYWNHPDWHFANHPVVGISWYQSASYAAWLNQYIDKLMPTGLIGTWQIRLPFEHEWEVAARYPDGRIFPWGNDYEVTNANIDENDQTAQSGPYYLMSTTAVGIYPKNVNPNGISDLAGNTWEWTNSVYRRQMPIVLSPNVDITNAKNMVIRGGSWYTCSRLARATCRRGCPPSYTGTTKYDQLRANEILRNRALVGFRIALVPAM